MGWWGCRVCVFFSFGGFSKNTHHSDGMAMNRFLFLANQKESVSDEGRKTIDE
jgi:hypothetical protein